MKSTNKFQINGEDVVMNGVDISLPENIQTEQAASCKSVNKSLSNKQDLSGIQAIYRGPISIYGSKVIFDTDSRIYFLHINEKEIIYLHNEYTEYELYNNKSLVYNIETKLLQVVQRADVSSKNMIQLFIHDGENGICNGLLYTQYLEYNRYSEYSLVCRSNITTQNSEGKITIDVGYMYILDFNKNKSYDIYTSTKTDYFLNYEDGKVKVLVFDVSDRIIKVLPFTEYDITKHVLLIQYDGQVGFYGPLYDKCIDTYITNNKNNNIECVSRARITYTNRTLTISEGHMYFRCGNIFRTFINQSEYTYTFTGSKSVVFDTTNNTIVDRENYSIKITDIPLLWYDGITGIDGGVLLKYIKQSDYDEKIQELENRITTENGTSLSNADLSDLIKPVMHGGTSTFPQNNLALYKLAGKNGVLFWECDVRPCLDGFVLSHDDDMYKIAVADDGSAISQGEYVCSQKTIAELKTLKVGVIKGTTSLVSGFENERIPTLEEFLTLCKKYGACPVLELKFGDSSRAEDLYNIVKKMGMLHKTIWLLYAGRNTWGNALHSLDDRNNIVYCGDESLPTSDIDEIISFKTEKNIIGLYYYISTLTDEIILRALENEVLIGTWSYTSTNNWNDLLEKGYSMFSLDDPSNNPLVLLR